jgi:hypothetical protein
VGHGTQRLIQTSIVKGHYSPKKKLKGKIILVLVLVKDLSMSSLFFVTISIKCTAKIDK